MSEGLARLFPRGDGLVQVEKLLEQVGLAGEAAVRGEDLPRLQAIVRRVPISDLCVRYVARLVRSTRPAEPAARQFLRDWAHWGVGPRRGGRSSWPPALDGCPEVAIEDIRAMAAAVLRHRIVLNYTAESQVHTTQTVIEKLIDTIPLHAAPPAELERVERVLKTT